MTIAAGQWATLVVQISDAVTRVQRLVAYTGGVARRYRKRDAILRWIVAAAACAPFVGQLRSTSGIVTAWTLALVPLIGLALPLLNYSRTVDVAKDMSVEYATILVDLRHLWRSFDVDQPPPDRRFIEINERYEAIDARLATLNSQLVELPSMKSLLDEVERKIRRSPLPKHIEDAGRRTHDDVFLLLSPRHESLRKASSSGS